MSIIGDMIRQLGRVTGAGETGEKIANGMEDVGHGATVAAAGAVALGSGTLSAIGSLPELAASNPVNMSAGELFSPAIASFSATVAQQLPAPPERTQGQGFSRS